MMRVSGIMLDDIHASVKWNCCGELYSSVQLWLALPALPVTVPVCWCGLHFEHELWRPRRNWSPLSITWEPSRAPWGHSDMFSQWWICLLAIIIRMVKSVSPCKDELAFHGQGCPYFLCASIFTTVHCRVRSWMHQFVLPYRPHPRHQGGWLGHWEVDWRKDFNMVMNDTITLKEIQDF